VILRIDRLQTEPPWLTASVPAARPAWPTPVAR
jgi:hypothetical protein